MVGRGICASPAELRIWLADRMAAHNSSHTVANVLRFHGPLNVTALRAAISELVAREPVARTTYRLRDDVLIREVTPIADILQPEIDLRAVDFGKHDQALIEVARRDALKPFDLANGPLLRATIVRLGVLDNALLLTIHHIAVDRTSRQVLIDRLAEIYSAAARDFEYPEAPPQIHNAGSLEDTDQGDTATRLAYWRKQLDGASAIDLSRGVQAKDVASSAGRMDFDLDATLMTSLRALAREAGCTLFMGMTAALAILLSRITGTSDIVIAVPIASHGRPGATSAVGFDVGLGILRIDLAGDPSFADAMRRVREVTLDAYRYAVPYDQLVRELDLDRSGRVAPLCNVVFAFANEPDHPPHFADCATSLIETPVDAVKFPLAVSMIDQGEEVQGIIEHETEFLSVQAVACLVAHIRSTLLQVAENPHCPIWDLSLSSKRSGNAGARSEAAANKPF